MPVNGDLLSGGRSSSKLTRCCRSRDVFLIAGNPSLSSSFKYVAIMTNIKLTLCYCLICLPLPVSCVLVAVINDDSFCCQPSNMQTLVGPAVM